MSDVAVAHGLSEEYKQALIPRLYRSEESAVRCDHLRFTPLLQTTETLRQTVVVPKSNNLVLPHEVAPMPQMRLQSVLIWPNFPVVSLMCVSPKMIDWTRALMPAEVRGIVNDLQTSLEKCRCCPFYQERKTE